VSYAGGPDQLLNDVWERVAAVPDDSGRESEWHFALGALFALAGIEALDSSAIQGWEQRAQTEAKRLGIARGG
jgi:hypothetical protein